MGEILRSLGRQPELFIGLTLGLASLIMVTLVVWIGTRAQVRKAEAREHSRRELAAYVAEGSISPEDAERMLQPRPWWAGGAKNGFDACCANFDDASANCADADASGVPGADRRAAV